MTCQEFETLWNDRLDAIRCQGLDLGIDRAPGAVDPSHTTNVVQDLDAHAATCASCRALAARYKVLQQSIESLSGPPSPPSDFAARFLAEHEHELEESWSPPRSRSREFPIRWALVAAAVLLAALGLFARREQPQDPKLVDQVEVPRPIEPENGNERPEVAKVPTPPPLRPRPLNETLAEATSVSLSLLWEASEPAARLGRDVLGSYQPSVGPTLAEEVPIPVDIATNDTTITTTPLTSTEVSDRDVIRSLGEQVGDGVRPLSRPALNAFAFLMPRIPEAEEFETPGPGTTP